MMAKTRRVVRKVNTPSARSFDERLWPVNVALAVLAAFLVGMVVAYRDFHDPVWYRNAWLWVTLIPAMVIALMAALRFVDNRRVRRAVQLAAILSLLFHILFLLWSLEVTLFARRTPPDTVARKPENERPRVVAPEYAQHHFADPLERPRQDYEKPVETETPDPPAPEVARQETQPEPPTPIPPPTPTPEPQPQRAPTSVVKQPVSETAPRAADQGSKLSRKTSTSRVAPNQTAEAPTSAAPTPAEAPKTEPAPDARSVARRPTERTFAQAAPSVESTAPVERPTTSAARRGTEPTARPETSATPTLPRQPTEPRATPRAAVAAADVPALTRQTTPEAPRPATTATTRREVSDPLLARQPTMEAPAKPSPTPSPSPQRQPAAPEQPTVATAPTPSPNAGNASTATATSRQASKATPNVVTEAAALATNVAPRTAADAQAATAASQVARQTTATPGATRVQVPLEAPASSASAQVARNSTPRAEVAAVPSVNPTAPATPAPARAVQSSPTAASPTAVESPAQSVAAKGTGEPAAQPLPTAVTRSQTGMAGAGQSANLDRAAPAAASPALVAAGAAQRSQATQNTPEGPALAPSESAVVRRSVAGQARPSATLRAEPIPIATAAGVAQPSQLTASAGAAVTQASSNAAPGAVNAAVGRVEVDSGPTQVVSERGAGRASGGGQPDASMAPDSAVLARSRSGGSPQMSLAATPVAAMPVAPAATGGGSPAPTPLAAQATATVRNSPGGEAPLTGGPSAAAAPGATAEASAAPQVAEAARSRADATSGSAEGGQPDASKQEEEERARRLARSVSQGAPQIAATGPTTVDAPTGTPAAGGEPASSGAAQGLPIEAQGIAAVKTAGGARGAPSTAPVGTVAAETPIVATAPGLAGGAPGQRQTTSGATDAPAAAALEAGGAVRRADSVATGAASAAPVDVPDLGAEVEQANVDHLAAAAAKGVRKTQTGGGPLAVDLAALEGPGGLGSQVTPDVGIQDRRAQEESLEVQPRAARFVRQQVGGLPNVSTAAVLPTDSFRQRTSRNPGSGGRNGSPPPQTEEAIEMGLAFLARYQGPDGRWSLSGFGEEVALSSDTAATGLGLLAFQGAGYNHREHKYQEVVRAALDHLLKNQKPDGDLFTPMDDDSNRSVWLYSHSIAALAVCEAYGMTQDPDLKESAQKAIDFIVAAQHKQRGGWRYAPGVGADTSVTGWMMMALKSGELAGLEVPPETFVGIQRWLDSSQASAGERHLYRYNPLAPDTETQRHGRQATRTMTSVGLLMRLYLGWRRDNPDMVRGAEYLLQAPPSLGTARNIERDTYYWYYATQVMFHVGGERWQQWNDKLHPLLVSSQVRQGPLAGSWDPRTPVPDRWAQHAGRLYVTTLNLLSLEVYYRHLPLYVETAK